MLNPRETRGSWRLVKRPGSSRENLAFSKKAHTHGRQIGASSLVRDDAKSPLQASVLVLNRSYVAVHVVNVRRAMCLVYRNIAEVIHIENGQFANYDFATWCELSLWWQEDESYSDCEFIRTVAFPVQVPRVVRLIEYDRLPRTTVRFNRRNLFARDDHRCQYCGLRFSTSELSIDHVIPRSRGGGTSWENVVCCCLRCNTKKGGRTPAEARMHLLKLPVRPRHNPNFAVKLRQPRYEMWSVFLGTPSESREQTA